MIILETERLLFREHLITDMDDYCAMEMDADVRRYVGGRPRTREKAEERFKNALTPVTNSLAMWATILKDDINILAAAEFIRILIKTVR